MLAEVTHVEQYVRFVSVDVGENRHRFSRLSWQPTLFVDGAIRRGWGGLGSR